MKSLTLALALLAAPALRAQPTPTMRSWNRPVDPYRIAGPVYSVGASDITSFLITTSEGHVLVNRASSRRRRSSRPTCAASASGSRTSS
jgi:metallo-beta-lactamase class B